jgi:hypothetical protein
MASGVSMTTKENENVINGCQQLQADTDNDVDNQSKKSSSQPSVIQTMSENGMRLIRLPRL